MSPDDAFDFHEKDRRSLVARMQSWTPRRPKTLGVVALGVATVLFVWLFQHWSWSGWRNAHQPIPGTIAANPYAISPTNRGTRPSTKLHVVLPASNRDVNVCKLVLGCSLLGYPTPTLLAWEEDYSQEGRLGGGSHMAKVSRVLEYLNGLTEEQDDELVLMLDAYDIQLQLPRSTLVDRYYGTRQAAQDRLVDFAGDAAVTQRGVEQLVLFGAGKRCAPNQPHTVACYAIPDSPVPADLYGPNTDTVVGHNHYYSVRQRYLNSGFIMGPAKAMRKVFADAWRIIEEAPEMDPEDDGSHGSDFLYHGSDQSVFAAMYGRQEFAREKIRLQHAPEGTRPRNSSVFFSYIDNVLNPSFYHEPFDVDVTHGHPYEYGIYLDFWSDVGHQTINSEVDAMWLTYDGRVPMGEQVGPRMPHFDCPTRAPGELPEDVTAYPTPTDVGGDAGNASSLWGGRPLYTHLCMGRVPVLRHMNGVKEHREEHWPMMWYQPRAREMLAELEGIVGNVSSGGVGGEERTLEGHKRDPTLVNAGGAWTDRGLLMSWGDMCPPEYEAEIFRDV